MRAGAPIILDLLSSSATFGGGGPWQAPDVRRSPDVPSCHAETATGNREQSALVKMRAARKGEPDAGRLQASSRSSSSRNAAESHPAEPDCAPLARTSAIPVKASL